MKKKLGTARKLINSIQHARTVTEYQLEDDYYWMLKQAMEGT